MERLKSDLRNLGFSEVDNMKGNYLARRMDNGEVVEGNLIWQEGSPFAYILTKENYFNMTVDELNNGATHCNLVRVIAATVDQIN